MKEEITRKKLIDPLLEQRGWKVHDKRFVYPEFPIVGAVDDQGNPVNDRFVDYVLFDNVGDPLAIVEAKKWQRNPNEGKEQAREYFEYIKQKYNKECFIFLTNGEDILFWDYPNSSTRKVMGFFTQDELMQRRKQIQSSSDPTTIKINESITERPYQLEAIKRVMEGIAKNKRKFLLTLATGTGKTRIAMSIIELLTRAQKINRVLFLTDRNALKQQAMGELGSSGFTQFFPSDTKKYLTSGHLEPAKLYAGTIQTLAEIYKELSPGYFDLIISDEAHRSIQGVAWNPILSYFDAIQIGLTATPNELLDKNTFVQFDCFDGKPTFNFSYEDAVNSTPPYLSRYQVLEARTNFQIKGIKPADIPLPVRKALEEQGIDLEELTIEGTDIGKKVMNKGTDEAIIQEFMEESIKDESGVLPTKSIIFAISKKHAQGLLDAFNRLYPEHKGELAETIYSGMERTDKLIDKFMKKDLPRVAISVDMLDTGIDVPEICNLVFAKPVFSKIKFWQMIGRGTRPDQVCKYRERLPDGKKEGFLIIDHWKNFENFQMNPEGKTAYLSEALPVRLFKTKVKKLKHFEMYGEKDNANKIKSEIEEMVSSLPKDNISVKENRRKLNHVFEDNFWDNVAEDPIDYVEKQVAPLLKYQSQVDVDEMTFQVKTEKLGLAILQQNDKTIKNLQKSIANDVNNLSNNLNAVKEIIDDKNKVLTKKFWEDIKYEDAEFLEKTFKPIIKLKAKRSREIIELDLDDIIAERKLIQKTTLGDSEFVKEYKIKIENSIKKLANDNPTIAKIMKGEEPNDEELMDLEHALFSLNEEFETESLRKIFKQPTGSFGQFIKHILGLYEFPNFEQECADAFDIFIKEHENWNADQILFVRTVKNTISKKGKMDISDLFEAPFDRIGTLSKLFEEDDVEDIMQICKTLEKRNNA